MTVLAGTEVGLSLDEEEFVEAQREALQRPAMKEAAGKALAAAMGMIAPAIVYDWFPVRVLDQRRAEVGGVVFALGRHADLLEPAEAAFAAIVTIGAGLEEESRGLQAAGKALDSFLLDAAGVFGVGKLIGVARSIVEREAAGRGWRVGAELAPGQLSGWPIADQILVAGLLGVGSIGVHVTESGMLVPQKSASLLVGAGPLYESSKVHSPCDYCDLGDTCRYRH